MSDSRNSWRSLPTGRGCWWSARTVRRLVNVRDGRGGCRRSGTRRGVSWSTRRGALPPSAGTASRCGISTRAQPTFAVPLPVNAMAWSDATRRGSCGRDHTTCKLVTVGQSLDAWDPATRRRVQLVDQTNAQSVAISADGETVVTAGWGSTVAVWRCARSSTIPHVSRSPTGDRGVVGRIGTRSRLRRRSAVGLEGHQGDEPLGQLCGDLRQRRRRHHDGLRHRTMGRWSRQVSLGDNTRPGRAPSPSTTKAMSPSEVAMGSSSATGDRTGRSRRVMPSLTSGWEASRSKSRRWPTTPARSSPVCDRRTRRRWRWCSCGRSTMRYVDSVRHRLPRGARHRPPRRRRRPHGGRRARLVPTVQ